MPDSSQANDVASYASAVRTALAPLPDAERESLLEDLENHLAEVASESDLSLQERLGPPEDYAAELRSAYGGGNETSSGRHRPVRERTAALLKSVSSNLTYPDLRALLPELRPGWWVLRAYLVVLFLAFLFRDGGNLRPIPNPFTSGGLLQIVASLVAIGISVRLGPSQSPCWRCPSLRAWAPVTTTAIRTTIRRSRISPRLRPATTLASPTSIPTQRMESPSKMSCSMTRMAGP